MDRVTYAASLVDDFFDYANEFRAGYCKMWKARGIMIELADIPGIVEDQDRLYKYLANCLEMEGFREDDVLRIRDWVLDKWNAYEVQNV